MKFNPIIHIGSKIISKDSPTFIIAEAGVNHGGDTAVAKQLIDIAHECGADAVKFQAFRTENLILKSVEKAPYQQKTTDKRESQFDMLKRLELKTQHYQELKDYCDAKGIVFLITPFDDASLTELESIKVDAYKVASTDTTNLPFLKQIAATGKPMLLSTGMSYMEEVELAMEEIHALNKDVILLQCTANYPINDNEANLNVIETYKAKFNAIIGYSDHSVGLGAALYAVPMGAKVLEKHFTIDKSQDGPDHLASLDPSELKEFVQTVRRIETYMGGFIKEPTLSELKTRASLQKCLVASSDIPQGEFFSESNITAKRTGGRGISPIKYREIIGKPATRHYSKDEIIEE
ncbi:MAG: N-acetylneuraminate synthase [Flavobacteriales bacterium]